MKQLLSLLAFSVALADAGTLFVPTYPRTVLVFDEAKGQVIDRIELTTGTPMGMRMSPDRKTIYATTIDHSGFEMIDVATHKVLKHFVLNTPTKQYRFRGRGAPDPQGKLFYAVIKEIEKGTDHYEIAKSKYAVIDLEQQKIAKTVDIPKEDLPAIELGRTGFEISPDGQKLYQFGQSIVVLQTSDFKVIERIELAKPDFPGMENIQFGGNLELVNQSGERVTVFNSVDPIVHNRVFGLGRFDLTSTQMNFSPIGPAPSGMSGLQVTPDRKFAYAAVTIVGGDGVGGGQAANRRCEFWSFDLTSDRVSNRVEFPCRSRFSFGISTNGKKLYTYGAGFQIDVYDAATLKHETTWDLNADVTGGGIVGIP
jgi:DNA-binding beta-propeller fold protein YncE